MRIYGKDIDIQSNDANANISLSFGRANMFSFGFSVPRCNVHAPAITPMGDYCCKYPAQIAGGIGLPSVNVCVSAITESAVNFQIESAGNSDVPIYEIFADAIVCGCCRPVTPAVTDALKELGMAVDAVPVYLCRYDSMYGGYAGGCLFYEPLTAKENGYCNATFAMCRDCYGVVCGVDLGCAASWEYQGEPQHSRDWCSYKFDSHLIDVNDYTFAWKWNNFVECASCWWECHCGVPITGAPMLADDVVIVMPNTREAYLCAPWSMSEGAAYTYCEYLAPKCVFDAGCRPRPLGLNFATWAIELSGCQYFMRNDLGCYTFDGATHIGGVDVAMPLVVSLYRNGTIYRSHVAFCGDYITCAQVVDIMGGIGVCCNIIYSEVASITELQDMSVPIAVSPSCYDVCVIAFAVDSDCNCRPMFGNLMQGATSLVSSDFHYVHIDGGWSTEDPRTHDDSMCYGCVCLPWIGNFFGCGIIDTIRRVSETYGCYINGNNIYSPKSDVLNINCEVGYCVYSCNIYQCGYYVEPHPCYISCNDGCEGAEPLLGQLAEMITTEQPARSFPVIDPYTEGVTYYNGRLRAGVNMPYLSTADVGWHAQLAGCCSQVAYAGTPPVQDEQCIYALVADCCRSLVALGRLTDEGCYGYTTCGWYSPIVCGDYGRGYAALGLCYQMDKRIALNVCYTGCTYSYDTYCPRVVCGEICGLYDAMCKPSKQVNHNAVTLTTQPSDASRIISAGVGSCFTWHGARYRIEKIDNYNPSAATCLKVFGIMV